MAQDPIPYIDLRPQHRDIHDELFTRWENDVARADFILGASVREFEAAFAAFIGTKHALAVNSGTDALLLALAARGVGAGDEVILPAFTFIATADVVIRLGAVPVLVDVDPRTYVTTAAMIEKAITPRTKAVMPVHLYGQQCDMPAIMAMAARRGITVIEDTAQACGSHIGGRMLGSFGHAGAYSFYPTKNLGAPGDGGMVTTNDDQLAADIRLMRDHGRGPDGRMMVLGYNSRMSSISASYLLLKLRRLPAMLEQRRAAARYYNDRFEAIEEITAPVWDEGYTYNNYTIRLATPALRDSVRQQLIDQGIGAAIYYDPPVHLQPVFAPYKLGPGSFPATEAAARSVLSLPAWPGISQAQLTRIADAVIAAVAASVARA